MNVDVTVDVTVGDSDDDDGASGRERGGESSDESGTTQCAPGQPVGPPLDPRHQGGDLSDWIGKALEGLEQVSQGIQHIFDTVNGVLAGLDGLLSKVPWIGGRIHAVHMASELLVAQSKRVAEAATLLGKFTGNPMAIAHACNAWAAVAKQANSTQHQVASGRLVSPGVWQGHAADSYRAALPAQEKAILALADSFAKPCKEELETFNGELVKFWTIVGVTAFTTVAELALAAGECAGIVTAPEGVATAVVAVLTCVDTIWNAVTDLNNQANEHAAAFKEIAVAMGAAWPTAVRGGPGSSPRSGPSCGPTGNPGSHGVPKPPPGAGTDAAPPATGDDHQPTGPQASSGPASSAPHGPAAANPSSSGAGPDASSTGPASDVRSEQAPASAAVAGPGAGHGGGAGTAGGSQGPPGAGGGAADPTAGSDAATASQSTAPSDASGQPGDSHVGNAGKPVIRVTDVTHGGRTAHVVTVPDVAFDMQRDGQTMSDPHALAGLVESAMESAGVKPGEPVLIAGQGHGADAVLDLVKDSSVTSRYDISSVVVAGGSDVPSSLPGGVPVLDVSQAPNLSLNDASGVAQAASSVGGQAWSETNSMFMTQGATSVSTSTFEADPSAFDAGGGDTTPPNDSAPTGGGNEANPSIITPSMFDAASAPSSGLTVG